MLRNLNEIFRSWIRLLYAFYGRDTSARDALSKGRIDQGMHWPRDASTKGCIDQGTHRPRDALTKGRIDQGMHWPRNASTKGCIDRGTHRPRDWTMNIRAFLFEDASLWNSTYSDSLICSRNVSSPWIVTEMFCMYSLKSYRNICSSR